MQSTAATNERLFCREQVQATNPLFRISRVFAPHGQAERLLPLYALFAVLEQLCSQSSDFDLAGRKLDWWRSECLQGSFASSGHPIVKELARTATGLALERDLLAQLFDTVESRLDAAAPVDLGDLERLCRSVAEPQYQLELRLCAIQPPVAAQAPAAACARNGLAQLIRESAGPGRAGRFWWLPLKLLARHGVNRADLGKDADVPATRALFGEILESALGWAGGLGEQREAVPVVPPAMRHFVVFSHLQACVLRRLRDSQPVQYAAAFKRVGASELFQAWQAARRISRP
jgi:phytoene/squalene synthetase